MSNLLEYKDYFGSVEYSEEDDCLVGKVLFIKSVIGYMGDTVSEIKDMFQSAVDDYLQLCTEQNIEPEKPFKGSLNIRIGEELHKSVALLASKNKTSINKLITEAIEEKIKKKNHSDIPQPMPSYKSADQTEWYMLMTESVSTNEDDANNITFRPNFTN